MSSNEATKRKLGASDKTPVAVLNELCIREGSFPVYEDVPHATDPKMFSVLAMAFDRTAKGSGRSKKEAKHEACANLIAILAKMDRFKNQLQSVPEIPRPTSDGDAVGTLLDICVQRDWPLATFEELQACGEPHSPIFTYICKLSSIKRTGTFSTKKGAKQIAARAMLEVVQHFQKDDEQMQIATLVSEPPEKTFRTYRELKNLPVKLTAPQSRDRHNFFLRLPEEDRNEAVKILMDDSNIYGTNKDKVDLVCAALKLKYQVTDIPDHKLQFKVFHLLGNHDCVLAGNDEYLYDRVIDFMKTMLNLQHCQTYK